jgi:hypothetical protein
MSIKYKTLESDFAEKKVSNTKGRDRMSDFKNHTDAKNTITTIFWFSAFFLYLSKYFNEFRARILMVTRPAPTMRRISATRLSLPLREKTPATDQISGWL